MRLSIIIPTYNNLDYLKFFLLSLKNNSCYEHEIVLHINNGSDGSLDYAIKNNIKLRTMRLRNFEDFEEDYNPYEKQKIKVKKMRDGKTNRIKTKRTKKDSE